MTDRLFSIIICGADREDGYETYDRPCVKAV